MGPETIRADAGGRSAGDPRGTALSNDQQDHGHVSDGQASLPHDAGSEQGGDFSEGQEQMHPDKSHPGSFAHGQQGEHANDGKPGTFAEGKRLG